MYLKLNLDYLKHYLNNKDIEDEIFKNKKTFEDSYQCLFGPNNLKGWFEVENHAGIEALEQIEEISNYVIKNAEVLVVLGIGGSNRGAMAVVEYFKAVRSEFPEIIWAGNNLSGTALKEVFSRIGKRSVMIDVIAKDFRTIEPGLSFRMFREYLKDRYADEYHKHVIVTGSVGSNQLKEMAETYQYLYLPFPENVGGRFSVLTPVGLLPMAVAGIDIRKLVSAASKTEKKLKSKPIEKNPAIIYSIVRKLLFQKGFQIEGFVFLEPSLEYFGRWLVQEFGETEGKIAEAIFPTSFSYSEDLHAIGQYIQEGRRFIFESYFNCFRESRLKIPKSKEKDGFDYLDQKEYDDVNRAVYQAAIEAHSEDGVPCVEFILPEPDEEVFGELFYFFLFTVYCSANLIGVNPFNQNGVENYKLNMYRILGK